MLLILFIFIFFTSGLYSVSTKYLGGIRFDRIEDYELSNITILESGGIELSPQISEFFFSEDMIWSFEEFKDGFLVGTGEKASLIFVNEKENKKVFSSSQHILFSDIKFIKDKFLVSALPKATIFILNRDFKVEKSINFTNEYIWRIIPHQEKVFVLCGNPAEIYILDRNYKVEFSTVLKNEKNLLNGLFKDDNLYFYSDANVFYRFNYTDKKIKALVFVDENIADMAAHGNDLYIVTSISKAKEAQKKERKNTQSVSSDSDIVESPVRSSTTSSSKLYKYNFQSDTFEKLFEKTSIGFTSVYVSKDKIFITTDEDASFYEFNIKSSSWKFTNIGKGKFLKVLLVGGRLYGLLIEPSRILRIIENDYAKKGSFISGVFDCEVKSVFGKPIVESFLPKKTDVKLYFKSGMSQNEFYWEDWAPFESDNSDRFIKFRIDMFSDGKNSPIINRILIPYLQQNLPPYIERFEVNQFQNSFKLTWQANDENKDTISYDIYISRNNTPFFKLNDASIEDSSFEISREFIPDGVYYIKLVASDKKSNIEAKETSKVLGPFFVDNTPPTIKDVNFKKNSLSFTIEDALSPIILVNYSINGKKWERINPVDGIYDSKMENFVINFKDNVEFVVIKVFDIYGNSAVFQVK